MKKLSIYFVTAALLLGACKKDENDPQNPTPTNEEELITTVTLHFYEKGNVDNHVMGSFRDVDGAGGNAATIDTIILDTNTIYTASIELLDESGTDVVDITTEVKEESDEHIFCYEPSTSEINITITDSDGTYPLGVETEWTTGNTASGSVKVTLKHQPNGQKDGSCSSGETDVEVDFPVVIQ